MSVLKSTDSLFGVYTLLVGLLYLSVGLVQFVNGVLVIENSLIQPDLFQGAVLAIVGAVFLRGFYERRRGRPDWRAFLSVGTLLAGIIFALYLFMLISNGLGWALGFEDWLDWTPIEQLQPGLWLFVATLPGVFASIRYARWPE